MSVGFDLQQYFVKGQLVLYLINVSFILHCNILNLKDLEIWLWFDGKFVDIGPTHIRLHNWIVPDKFENCSLIGI